MKSVSGPALEVRRDPGSRPSLHMCEVLQKREEASPRTKVLVGFCAVLELESWWVLWDAVIQQEKLQAVEVLKGFSQSAFVLQALQVGFILLPQLKLKASIN